MLPSKSSASPTTSHQGLRFSDENWNSNNVSAKGDLKATQVASEIFPTSEEIEFAVFTQFSASVASSSNAVPKPFAPCHKRIVKLKNKIERLNTVTPESSCKVREENNKRFNYMIDTLNVLAAATDPRNSTRDTGLQVCLAEKLSHIESFIEEHFSSTVEKQLGDFFDFWELDLRKIADELKLAPKTGALSNIILDDATRLNWEHRFLDDYSVPYEIFYNNLILCLFPEMKENNDFRNFITYLINPLGNKQITAYSFKLFVDFFGPLDQLHDNVVALTKRSGFVGNMSRLVVESMLEEYHIRFPDDHGRSIVRFSRTRPGALVVSYSYRDAQGKIRYRHHINSDAKNQVLSALTYQTNLMERKFQGLPKIMPLPINTSTGKILEDLPKPESSYSSFYHRPKPDFPCQTTYAFFGDD